MLLELLLLKMQYEIMNEKTINKPNIDRSKKRITSGGIKTQKYTRKDIHKIYNERGNTINY